MAEYDRAMVVYDRAMAAYDRATAVYGRACMVDGRFGGFSAVDGRKVKHKPETVLK